MILFEGQTEVLLQCSFEIIFKIFSHELSFIMNACEVYVLAKRCSKSERRIIA